jgi:hypothetical protein
VWAVSRLVKFECIDYRQNIVSRSVGRIVAVSWVRLTGRPETPPRNGIEVVSRLKFRSKSVPFMSISSKCRKKDPRSPRSTPIQHLELYVFLDGDKLNGMWGRVFLFRPFWACRMLVESEARAMRDNRDLFMNSFNK